MVNFAEPPSNVLRLPKWVFAIYVVQAVFAIIILGLDAYGIHYIAYNALIYSLVVCICTMFVVAYLLASQLFLHKLYNMWIALAFHLWMLLFWIVDLGLVANLARIWSSDNEYTFTYYYTSYYGYRKRSNVVLSKREDTTTFETYHGALAAGAVFAAVEFVLWIGVTALLLIAWNKHRQTNATTTHASQPPPQYGADNGQAVPMEKYNQTGVPQPQPTPQQQYAQPVQSQQQYAQQPQQQYMQPQQHQAPYAQPPQQQHHAGQQYEPVPRQDTVSPASSAAYGYAPPSNVSELNTPQPTGNAYPSNASELSTPQHTAYQPNVSELSNQK